MGENIKVAKILDEYTIVLNKGKLDGIEEGERFLVYSIGDEILDPETKVNLGKLEIIKGTGKVVHLQDKIATVRSDMKTAPLKTIRKPASGKSSLFFGYIPREEVEEYLPPDDIPFENIACGDLAKPI